MQEAPHARIVGLDSIRAICAFWVVMGHFGKAPLTAGIDDSSWLGWLVGGLLNNFWNGPAAVIVFFVISGFCIHYPHSRTLTIPSKLEYWLRRYVRIGIPLLVVIGLSQPLSVRLSLFHDSVLWSLVAELVYYTIYPALLLIRQKGVSWNLMLGASFIVAMALAATDPGAGDYPSWGAGLNWVLGLPCWIAGCALAEQVSRSKPTLNGSIWMWRLTVLVASMAVTVLRFHFPISIGYPWTLNIFALLVAVWLAKEIAYFSDRRPSGWLEKAGKWSYSVYLVHVPANAIFKMIAIPNIGYMLNWSAKMVFILCLSYGFYLLVEYPSHYVARRFGRALAIRKRASSMLP